MTWSTARRRGHQSTVTRRDDRCDGNKDKDSTVGRVPGLSRSCPGRRDVVTEDSRRRYPVSSPGCEYEIDVSSDPFVRSPESNVTPKDVSSFPRVFALFSFSCGRCQVSKSIFLVVYGKKDMDFVVF